jgi:hypothetical protein
MYNQPATPFAAFAACTMQHHEHALSMTQTCWRTTNSKLQPFQVLPMAVQQLPWDPWQGINPWQLLLQIAVSVAAAAAVTNCSTPQCQVSQYIDHQASCCHDSNLLAYH